LYMFVGSVFRSGVRTLSHHKFPSSQPFCRPFSSTSANMTITRVTMFKLAEEDIDKVLQQYDIMKANSHKVTDTSLIATNDRLTHVSDRTANPTWSPSKPPESFLTRETKASPSQPILFSRAWTTSSTTMKEIRHIKSSRRW
jgi:hypothetical protein